MSQREIPWPHAPLHQLTQSGTFIVTAATYNKEHCFRGAKRLAVLHRGLLKVAHDFNWRLEAWAAFSNHYHFIGHSPDAEAKNLSEMISTLHAKTAGWINRLDRTPGRQVWFSSLINIRGAQRAGLNGAPPRPWSMQSIDSI
ncbi:MAG: hypothetical protein L0Y58_24640 [Verrucomicrobia subdivision 3 bacterium]|nr:hypothetical protein [Limisphaerales bacterium]